MNNLVLTWFCFMQWIFYSHGYYYWKDYHNIIPLDAYPAGVDVTREKVYIGQAFIKPEPHQGIYPTSIVKREDVYAPVYGCKKADNFVQILCSNDPENFEWIPANKTHLHLVKTNNELVRGGVEDDKWLNIARLKYQGGTVVGKVLSGFLGNAEMWFVHNGNDFRADSYEILTYNDLVSKISIRTSD